jgi:hypothetical protein
MDTLTIQGQDSRKLKSTNFDVGKVVMGMAPTPSDAGKQPLAERNRVLWIFSRRIRSHHR